MGTQWVCFASAFKYTYHYHGTRGVKSALVVSTLHKLLILSTAMCRYDHFYFIDETQEG